MTISKEGEMHSAKETPGEQVVNVITECSFKNFFFFLCIMKCRVFLSQSFIYLLLTTGLWQIFHCIIMTTCT